MASPETAESPVRAKAPSLRLIHPAVLELASASVFVPGLFLAAPLDSFAVLPAALAEVALSVSWFRESVPVLAAPLDFQARVSRQGAVLPAVFVPVRRLFQPTR